MVSKIHVTVLYFAQIHEITKVKREIMELSENALIKNLLSMILTRYPDIKYIKNIKVSVNYEIVNPNTILNDNDEVALLPPISGG